MAERSQSDPNPGVTRIFVYGSLKRGLHNAHYLAGQSYVGDAQTRPCYRLVSLGSYPGMIHAPADGRSIHGELWDVDDTCKQRLDVLEGVALGEYRLELAQLTPTATTAVWTYIYAQDTTGCSDAGECWLEK